METCCEEKVLCREKTADERIRELFNSLHEQNKLTPCVGKYAAAAVLTGDEGDTAYLAGVAEFGEHSARQKLSMALASAYAGYLKALSKKKPCKDGEALLNNKLPDFESAAVR